MSRRRLTCHSVSYTSWSLSSNRLPYGNNIQIIIWNFLLTYFQDLLPHTHVSTKQLICNALLENLSTFHLPYTGDRRRLSVPTVISKHLTVHRPTHTALFDNCATGVEPVASRLATLFSEIRVSGLTSTCKLHIIAHLTQILAKRTQLNFQELQKEVLYKPISYTSNICC